MTKSSLEICGFYHIDRWEKILLTYANVWLYDSKLGNVAITHPLILCQIECKLSSPVIQI